MGSFVGVVTVFEDETNLETIDVFRSLDSNARTSMLTTLHTERVLLAIGDSIFDTFVTILETSVDTPVERNVSHSRTGKSAEDSYCSYLRFKKLDF